MRTEPRRKRVAVPFLSGPAYITAEDADRTEHLFSVACERS